MGSQESDEQIVARAARGEREAFDAIVRRYQRPATAKALRLLNNMDDAMEVCQDAFLSAFENLSSLRDPRQLGPWMLRIVSNLALNKRRSRALRKAASLESTGDGQENTAYELKDPSGVSPVEEASARDLQALLEAAVLDLPPMQRQALELFSFHEMPQQEVAKILGCSVEAVKWHVFTARKKLKEKLKEYL